jgi:tyrosine-protein phosphatase YwqE
MKISLALVLFPFYFLFSKVIKPEQDIVSSQKKISILVLPTFDIDSNGGGSPDVQKHIIESIEDTKFTIMKFPYKKLMNVPYHQVFDKKYCKLILHKIKPDIIIMSKLEQINRYQLKWNLRVRILDTKTMKQINSSLKCDSLGGDEIKLFILRNKSKLITEVKLINSF